MNAVIAVAAFLVVSCHANPMPNAAQCGSPDIKPDTAKIVGGKDAIPYSWPWQAALFMKPTFGTPYQFCAGSLISPEWIMTAGHCFYGDDKNPGKYQVKLGVFDKSRSDEPGELVSNISEIHVNPKFDSGKITWDITLLKLSAPVKYASHISPICLPKQAQELPAAGSDLFVTGWGAVRQGGADSKTLKQVTVPLVDTAGCKAAYPGLIYEDVMFCAGLKEGGKDSCQGDSGGPVVYQDKQTGAWTQYGITSWGYGCAQPQKFGVYSKVSAYLDFIRQYVQA